VRQGAKTVAGRWARSARALRKEERACGEELAKLAKAHSSEAFVACDSPLEAALFSALVGLLRYQEEDDVDL
jgi:kynureninase